MSNNRRTEFKCNKFRNRIYFFDGESRLWYVYY